MSDSYYVRSQGKVHGPYTFEDLKTKAGKGHLKKTHQISTDRQKWQSARRIEGLFGQPAKPAEKKPDSVPLMEPDLIEPALITDSPRSESRGVVEELEADDQTEWHYCLQGDEQTQGPVSESKLRRLFQSGRLPLDTLVWNEDLTDWVEASRIPALRKSGEAPLVDVELEPDGPELPVPPMASASLILAILGIAIPIGVGSVLAIVFGHLSLNQIKANRGVFQGQGTAKAGMITGYVTLAILFLAGTVWLIYKIAS